MKEVDSPVETEVGEDSLDREVSLLRYPGCKPVRVRTAHLDGEEPSREERIRAGLRRMVQEGRFTLPQ